MPQEPAGDATAPGNGVGTMPDMPTAKAPVRPLTPGTVVPPCIVARAPRSRDLALARTGADLGRPFSPPEPDGIVEIVERTTTVHVRSNGSRKPGTGEEVEDHVLATLTPEQAAQLAQMLSVAIIGSLDTRKDDAWSTPGLD